MRELYEADFHKPDIFGEADKYELTRGACFVARRLEVVAVAVLLWISWCVLGGAGFIHLLTFSSNTHGLLQARMRTPCLIHLSTSIGVFPTPRPLRWSARAI